VSDTSAAGSTHGTGRVAATARWLISMDPPGLLYGAVLSAAVIAMVTDHPDDSTRVAVTTSVVLVIYWLAHSYIYALSDRLRGDQGPARGLLKRALVHETSVLMGGAPAIVVYVIATALGRTVTQAGNVALWFSVLLLAAVGFVGGHHAGYRGVGAIKEALGAALLGALVIFAKSLLH